MAAEREDALDADEPWPLPQGWGFAKLGEIVERLTDGTHQPPKFEKVGVPFVVIGNIKGHAIDWSSVSKWVSLDTYETEAKRLRPRRGDVLYTAVGSYGLAVNVADDRDFMFQRHIAFLRPNSEAVDPNYLSYVLNSPTLKRQADRAARGVAQKTVTLGSLRDFVLPLAPLSEQRRIVARIDELFAEIAEGEAALELARSGLDTWRRALLKAAVTGEVTRDWRERNESTESGAGLIKFIQAQRSSADGPRKSTRSDSRALVDLNDAPEIPDTWSWAKFGDVIEGMEYGTSEKCDTDQIGIPVLRMGNIFEGKIDYGRLKFGRADKLPALIPGDILFNRTNSAELVGKSAVYRGSPNPCSFASYLIRVRAPALNSDFVAAWINSAYGRQWITENKSQQVGQANLSGGKLCSMPIPIPPRHEQDEMASRLADAMAAKDDLHGLLSASELDKEALRQSILKSAFEGRLVPQDPNDEPASILVARLRAEAPSTPRRTRGRKTAS